MELQDVIKIRRKELGLSLEQIANACGVGKSIVGKWERGDIKNIRRDNLAALSEVLNVSPLVLMGREELQNNDLDDIEQSLLNNFRKLNQDGQSKVVEYTEDLIFSGKYKKYNKLEQKAE